MRMLKTTIAALLVLALTAPGFAAPKAADVPPLVEKLKKGNAKEKASALKELGHIGSIRAVFVKDYLPQIIDATRDKDINVRIAALEALGKVNPDAEKAVAIYVDALKDSDDKIKAAAALGLQSMGTDGKPAADELRKIRDDIRKLNKEEQQKKQSLNRAVGDALQAVQGGKKN